MGLKEKKKIKLTEEAKIILSYWRDIEAGKDPKESYEKCKRELHELERRNKEIEQ